MQKLRTLFVTDGPATGGAAAAALGADPAIELVGRALGPEAGARLVEAEGPDVVVLYASHSAGHGRALLEKAAAARGAPVVAVESHRPPIESFESLRRRVKAAVASSRARPRAEARSAAATRRGTGAAKLIAIGASTGGVEALVDVLSQFPETCPPTVVVQHMPPFFTTSFAARLHAVCRPTVHEAWDGAPLERGTVYLAPGGSAHLEVVWNSTRKIRLVESEPVNRHRPSVDVTFHSVARQIGQGSVGVLLTGMGRDGADGLKAMRDAGARTIAQDRESSTVYGMPRAALENGAVDQGTPLGDIAAAIFDPAHQAKEAMSWR